MQSIISDWRRCIPLCTLKMFTLTTWFTYAVFFLDRCCYSNVLIWQTIAKRLHHNVRSHSSSDAFPSSIYLLRVFQWTSKPDNAILHNTNNGAIRMHSMCNLNKVNASLLQLVGGGVCLYARYRITLCNHSRKPLMPHRSTDKYWFCVGFSRVLRLAVHSSSSSRYLQRSSVWGVALYALGIGKYAPDICTHFMNCVSLSSDLLFSSVSPKTVHLFDIEHRLFSLHMKPEKWQRVRECLQLIQTERHGTNLCRRKQILKAARNGLE